MLQTASSASYLSSGILPYQSSDGYLSARSACRKMTSGQSLEISFPPELHLLLSLSSRTQRGTKTLLDVPRVVPLTCHGHSRPITHLNFSYVVDDDQYYLISACKGTFSFLIAKSLADTAS